MWSGVKSHALRRVKLRKTLRCSVKFIGNDLRSQLFPNNFLSTFSRGNEAVWRFLQLPFVSFCSQKFAIRGIVIISSNIGMIIITSIISNYFRSVTHSACWFTRGRLEIYLGFLICHNSTPPFPTLRKALYISNHSLPCPIMQAR